MAIYPNYIIPRGIKVRDECDTPTLTEMDELYYDYNTNCYRSKVQDAENQRLRDELLGREEKRKKGLKSIVGYFYKQR